MYIDRESLKVRQTLEGERDVVKALYAKIKADIRHFVYQEDTEEIRERHFVGWGMKNMEELEVPEYMEPARVRPVSPSRFSNLNNNLDSDYDPFQDPSMPDLDFSD